MNTLTLSVNGLYLISDEKIYFTKEDKSYELNEISFNQWIDIFAENTSFAIQNKLIDRKDLYSFQRKLVYQLSEYFSFDKPEPTFLFAPQPLLQRRQPQSPSQPPLKFGKYLLQSLCDPAYREY